MIRFIKLDSDLLFAVCEFCEKQHADNGDPNFPEYDILSMLTSAYDELDKKLSKPMRTAQDYKEREELYSTSNRIQDKIDAKMDKERANAKRPLLGALARKIARKEDEEYRGTNRSRNRKHRGNSKSNLYDIRPFKESADLDIDFGIED